MSTMTNRKRWLLQAANIAYFLLLAVPVSLWGASNSPWGSWIASAWRWLNTDSNFARAFEFLVIFLFMLLFLKEIKLRIVRRFCSAETYAVISREATDAQPKP
jgi:hypothetical protein